MADEPRMPDGDAEDTLRKLEKALGAVSGGLAALVAAQQAKRDLIRLEEERARLSSQLADLRGQIEKDEERERVAALAREEKRAKDQATIATEILDLRGKLEAVREEHREAENEHRARIRERIKELDGLQAQKDALAGAISAFKEHIGKAPVLSG